MTRTLLLLTVFLLRLAGAAAAAELDPALRTALAGGGEVPVIVRLQPLAMAPEAGQAGALDRRAFGARLQQQVRISQAPLLAFLAARGVVPVRSLVLINALALHADAALVELLAARSDVVSIALDGTVPRPQLPVRGVVTAAAVPSAVTPWNLNAINAPALWTMGYHGEGMVVATLDTGVETNTSGLAASYRGGSNSWFDPYGNTLTPSDFLTDNIYHGTAVMGLLVGSATGVAPGAKWIAARIFPPTGQATYSAIHSAFDWVLDPDGNPATDDAPDVVNNSWSLDLSSAGTCITEFAADAQRLREAGIAVVFAGGNAGTTDPNTGALIPRTSLSPGNNAGNLAAGMVDSQLLLDTASSAGPSPCDPAGTVYPDLVAPGVNITSLAPGGTVSGLVGTSFSSPHVAGVMVLLKQAESLAVGSGLQRAVIESARLDLVGLASPDNFYGHGMLDAANALNNLRVVDQPPNAAVPLAPADGATGLNAAAVTVSWTPGTDPDGEQVRSLVIWGTDPNLNGASQVLVAAVALAPAGLAIALLMLPGALRRRRVQLLLAMLLLATAAGLYACGGGGSSAPPPPPSYTLSGLTPGTTYYWRIDQVDERGRVTNGPVRSFATAP